MTQGSSGEATGTVPLATPQRSNASGFLFELVAAADAGDVLFTGAALHTKKHLAVGALEVLIVLAVLHALGKLGGLEFPVGSQVDIFAVLGNALLVIAGEHAEKRADIESQAEKGHQAAADKAAQNGQNKTGDEGKHTEVVEAMTAEHETGKRFTETLHKRHFVVLPFKGISEIFGFAKCEIRLRRVKYRLRRCEIFRIRGMCELLLAFGLVRDFSTSVGMTLERVWLSANGGTVLSFRASRNA